MELKVDNKIINYMKVEDEDYISITDMLNLKMVIFLLPIG